ncbi:MAG TPA: O-antigen ligase family protein [Bacteroidia bacterium]|nr:O-antigen ligase family protein [Bacteroidia bacterium]
MLEAAVFPGTYEIRSSLFDRILIFLLVFSIYFEANLPYFRTASTPFLIFGFTFAYIGLTRLNTLLRLFSSKYFVASIGFAVVCIFMETLHPFSSYDFIFRYLNMTLGIFCIAVLCRDKTAFDVSLFAFILASAFQSLFLIFGTEPLLRSLSAEGFYDASRARIQAFETFFLRGNLNDISYFSSIGAVIGLIWMYFEKVKWKRYVLLFLTVPSVLGVFLPASRTGAVVFFVSILIFVYKSKINLKSWVLPSLVLIIFLFIAVPDVVWVRLGSVLRFAELQESDSRTKVYTAVLKTIDQYALTGIGAGNYWHGWAVSAGITNRFTTDVAMAAHNAFFQLWIYWGLPGLLYFLGLIYLFWTALDKEIYGNRRKSCLYIFIAMIPMIFLFYHSFYHKSFSIGLGMLLGARFWNIYEDSNESKKEEEMS